MNWQSPSNGQAHRTSRFSSSEPVFRRGQEFTFTVYLSQAPQGGEAFSFVAETGSSPSESQGTRASFGGGGGGAWGASLVGREGNQLSFSLTSPASAPVGRWKLSLRVGQGNARLLGQFVLLFNPWCSGDPVYLSDEASRQEYVLNENGIIFVGNAKYIEARGWYYGQFQKSILDLCLLLLDLSLYHRKDAAGDTARRGDPRYVSRVVSSMVNGNDNDNGVLEGKWSEEFAHHENPSRWDGSVAILWKWAKDRYRPVQYGQCWVFAGVAATALRCLGIPTRLITNFNSAHDADHNLAIDKYYDPSGKSLKIGQDSVWDYHVWNECWFVRGDLGGSYSGWQVIDATPQERSQDSPEERVAYRRALAELSGSHAAPTEEAVEEEASSRARASEEEGVPPASVPSPASPASDLISQPGLFGRFRLARPPVLGGDVALVLSLSNLREEPTDVTVHLSVATALYTRRTIREVLKESTAFRLQGKEGSFASSGLTPLSFSPERQLPLRITYGHYGAALTDDRKLLVTALCDVPGGVKLLVEKAITLEGPDIRIKVPSRVVSSTPTTVEIGYGNPLPVPVDQCVLLVTLMGHAVKINVAALAPGEQSSIFFEFTPRTSGAMQLHVDFSCDRFQHVKAFTLMDVAEA
nr:protein-glutamine gamma-glutamyltransferase E-like [Anolis sagrei ordinatus]